MTAQTTLSRRDWMIHETDKLDELLEDGEIDLAEHTRQAMLIAREAEARFGDPMTAHADLHLLATALPGYAFHLEPYTEAGARALADAVRNGERATMGLSFHSPMFRTAEEAEQFAARHGVTLSLIRRPGSAFSDLRRPAGSEIEGTDLHRYWHELAPFTARVVA